MTYRDFVSTFAKQTRLAKEDARQALWWVFSRIALEARMGGRLSIPEFGTFDQRVHKRRKVVNVEDGREMVLPAQTRLGFRPSKAQKRRKT